MPRFYLVIFKRVKSDTNGITILEVLIVVAMVAILSGIGIWNSQGMVQGYRVRGAARQVYSDMQMARLRAVKEGNQWAVQFSGNTYTVRNNGTDSTWGNANDVIVKTANLSNDYPGVTVTLGTTIAGNGNREVFNPNGTATGTVTNGGVILANASKTKSVCISSNTGNIRIVDGACP